MILDSVASRFVSVGHCLFSFPSSAQLTLMFQEIWVNLMLLYVGLSVVSIAINLCASGLIRQLKKTGTYLKILHFFNEGGNADGSTEASTNGEHTSDKEEPRNVGCCERLQQNVPDQAPGCEKPMAGLEEGVAQREKKYGSIQQD